MTSRPKQDAEGALTHALTDAEGAKPLNARQRLVKALQVIDGMPFAKDLTNSQYKSVPIDQMRNAVRKACIEAGLIHRLIDIEYTTESRGATTVVMGRAVLRFESVDDPADFVDQPTLGQSQDNGDKNLAKFTTNLLKNAYKTLLCIGEQDDIDSYSNVQIEEEAERIEAIRERRARRQEQAAKDPFFAKAVDPLADLRKRIGPLMQEGHADVVLRYKAEHGQVPTWDEATLRACIAECEKEGGQ